MKHRWKLTAIESAGWVGSVESLYNYQNHTWYCHLYKYTSYFPVCTLKLRKNMWILTVYFSYWKKTHNIREYRFRLQDFFERGDPSTRFLRCHLRENECDFDDAKKKLKRKKINLPQFHSSKPLLQSTWPSQFFLCGIHSLVLLHEKQPIPHSLHSSTASTLEPTSGEYSSSWAMLYMNELAKHREGIKEAKVNELLCNESNLAAKWHLIGCDTG